MCSHFSIASMSEINSFLRELNLPVVNANDDPSNNDEATEIYPNIQAPVLIYQNNQLQLNKLNWGFENPIDKRKPPIFNARIERFYEAKPSMWDQAFAQQRCLIIAARFYESHPTETVKSAKTGRSMKRPYQFKLADQDLFFIAGIYEADHFAMVTTEPNEAVRPYHNRMPLLLEPAEIRTWLFQNFTELVNRPTISLDIRPAEWR